MRAGSLRKKLGLAAATTVVLGAALEFGARAAWPEHAPLQSRTVAIELKDGQIMELPGMPMLHGEKTSDPRIRFEFGPNLHFLLRYDAGGASEHDYMYLRDGWFLLEIETNALGMRGALPLPVKAAGTRRVVCVGDSFTFGDGVPNEAGWVAQLADAYTQAGGTLPLETVNLGVPGYDSTDVAAEVAVRVPALDPDLVLWCVVLNDPPLRASPAVAALSEATVADLLETVAPHTGLARCSRIAALAQSRLRTGRLETKYRAFIRTRFEANDPAWLQFQADLNAVQRTATELDAKLLVCVFPMLDSISNDYPFRAEHERILAACKQRGILAIDLLGAFDGQHAEDLWVHPTDQHPNPRAHRLAVEWLATELIAHEDELLR